MRKPRFLCLIVLIVLPALACSVPQAMLPTPTPTEAPTPLPLPTSTPIPTPTLEPTITPSPTVPPTPTSGPGTFYVYPDGSGDYATLEDAVDAVYEGSTIILGEGAFALATGALEIDKALTLRGEGLDQTIITGDGGEYVVHLSGQGPFALEGITFQYEGVEWGDVVTIDEGEVEIVDCRFTGAIYNEEEGVGGDGLYLLGTASAQVHQSRFDHNGLNGIGLYGEAQAVLLENSVTENGQDGISYWDSSGGEARGNESSSNGWDGIGVQDQAQPTLEENICRDNTMNGIGFYREAGGTATANQCSKNARAGILVTEDATPTLLRNICEDNGETGIAFLENSGGEARSNTCTGNPQGLLVEDTAAPELMDNNCGGGATTGATTGATPDATPGGNTELPPASDPVFAPMTVSLAVDDDNQPVDAATTFPAGTLKVYVTFDYQNMSPGTEWTRAWYRDGAEILSKTEAWDSKVDGRYSIWLFKSSGAALQSASYEVRIFIEGELQQTASFVIGD